MHWNRRTIPGLVIALATFVGAGRLQAQFATALLNEGTPLEELGNITAIDTPYVNTIGGFAIAIQTNDGSGAIGHIWGSPDGISPPTILLSETDDFGLINVTSIDREFGLSDTGDLAYNVIGNGPNGAGPFTFLNNTLIVEPGTMVPAGPLSHLFWSSPGIVSITADGVPYWVGRTRATAGGSTNGEGFFSLTDPAAPIVYSGDLLPGLPAIMETSGSDPFADGFALSSFGSEWMSRVQLETTGTGIATAERHVMVRNGVGLVLGGRLVQENHPLPGSIGGLTGENWDNFDVFQINDFGEFIITGDSLAATTVDEFFLLNGQIALREGDFIGPDQIGGAIETAALNDKGDWLLLWSVNGGTEALIFNGQIVVREGDAVDIDGDNIVDPGAVISDFNGLFSTGIQLSNPDAAGNVTIYFNADVDTNGTTSTTDDTEGLYKIVVQTNVPQNGDLEISIEDQPDPQTTIPGDITYTVRARNNGFTTVNNVLVTTDVDATLSNILVNVPATIVGNTVEVDLGTIEAGRVGKFTITATATTPGTKVTTTSVDDPGDPDASNDSAIASTDVGLITDVAVEITASPDPVTDVNGLLTYTVTVFNNGPSVAPDVDVVMNLDPTTTYVSSDPVAVHNLGQITADITGPNGLNGPMPADSEFEFDVVVQVSTEGTLFADVSVSSSELDPVPGNNNAMVDSEFALRSDLLITITDNADPIQPGDQIVYTVEVENNGPTDATGVVADILLDADTSLVSVTAPGVANGSNVQAVIGNLADNASVTFTITVDTVSPDRYLRARAIVSGSGMEPDPDESDNVSDAVTAVFASAAGSPEVVISTINGHPTAQAPGLPGREFDVLNQPQPSPNGRNWALLGDLSGTAGTDKVILRSIDGVLDIVVQEGVTLDDFGTPIGDVIDQQVSINNAGDFAFTTNADPNTFDPQTPSEIAIKNVGGVQTTVARQGDINFTTFQSYYFDIRSPILQSDGTLWFYALMGADGPPPFYNFNITGRHIYEEDGLGGTIVQLQTLPNPNYVINGTLTPGYYYSSLDRYEMTVREDETEFLVVGLADDFVNPVKDVASIGTANAAPGATLTAVVEEGAILPGLSSPVASILGSSDHVVNRMVANGDWFVIGSNADGGDWVVRTGTVVASKGAQLFPSADEAYDDTGFSSGFYLATGNSVGDYIVGSVTDWRDDDARSVLVLNGERILARSHDPIDVDGNGFFDDDSYIRSFGNHDIILADDGTVLVNATLETGSGSTRGEAPLRFNINPDVDCALLGDINGDTQLNGLDVQSYTDCLLAGNPPTGGCLCADIDDDGEVTVADTNMFATLLVTQP